jgi:hypothetical protein
VRITTNSLDARAITCATGVASAAPLVVRAAADSWADFPFNEVGGRPTRRYPRARRIASESPRTYGTSKEALLKLVAMFPTANRAGCALRYLAQLSPPAEREAFLTRTIADHSDAWYGDGTQVGPFAKAQLAALYASTGRQAEALTRAEEVAREFPESVDHSGSRLTDTLRRMKLLQ